MVSFSRLAQLEVQGSRGVLVTVVDARGSTPRKAGARMVWLENGVLEGTVGGGAVEHKAVALCADVLASGEARFLEVQLGQELGMCCGGTMRLYLEPIQTRVPFLLLGGGHVARACAALLPGLGFDVTVADGRDGFTDATHFPAAVHRVDGLDEEDLNRLPFGPQTHVLVATHDHQLDQRLVESCLRRPSKWLGMIGSRRKALKTRERCLHKGFSLQEIGHLTSPVGLALGAQTPEEIALSIASHVVALRRLGALPASGIHSMALALGEVMPRDDDGPALAPPLTLKAKGTG